jgi:hypothetical protein
VVEPLHISFNHYGAHGHCDSHVSSPIPLHDDEDFRPSPVRILMRDGQRLPEPEWLQVREAHARPEQDGAPGKVVPSPLGQRRGLVAIASKGRARA